MGCYTCETGQDPPEQSDMTLEELEEDFSYLMQPETQEMLKNWFKSRPAPVQEVLKRYPPHLLFRVKKGAPYKYTVGGSLVAPHSVSEVGDQILPKFKVLRSPKGYAGVTAHIAPEYLEPVTLEELRERERGVP